MNPNESCTNGDTLTQLTEALKQADDRLQKARVALRDVEETAAAIRDEESAAWCNRLNINTRIGVWMEEMDPSGQKRTCQRT